MNVFSIKTKRVIETDVLLTREGRLNLHSLEAGGGCRWIVSRDCVSSKMADTARKTRFFRSFSAILKRPLEFMGLRKTQIKWGLLLYV